MEKSKIENLQKYATAVMFSASVVSTGYKINDMKGYLFLHYLLLEELKKDSPNEIICDYLMEQIPLEMDRIKDLKLEVKQKLDDSKKGWAIVDELRPEAHVNKEGNFRYLSRKEGSEKVNINLDPTLSLEELEKKMKVFFNK